jgi:hypothetical protein
MSTWMRENAATVHQGFMISLVTFQFGRNANSSQKGCGPNAMIKKNLDEAYYSDLI